MSVRLSASVHPPPSVQKLASILDLYSKITLIKVKGRAKYAWGLGLPLEVVGTSSRNLFKPATLIACNFAVF